MNVIEKSNWFNPNYEYLKNKSVVEYDLKDGGLSVIKEYNLLKPEYIDKLSKMTKENRKIVIGKLQARNSKLAVSLVKAFGDARELFVNTNHIQDSEILCIKKDALFIINRTDIVSQVSNNLLFRPKNSYSSIIRLNEKEFYYDPETNILDTKGFTDNVKDEERDFLFKDIKNFLKQSEKINKQDIFINLKQYRMDYLNLELPILTYKNIDNDAYVFDNYSMDNIDKKDLINADISHNFMMYLMPMFNLILSSY